LGAYLLGSIPTAYIIARWTRGIDIRQYGSGNVGASNVSAVVSRWWTIPVTIFDLGKGMLVVYLAKLAGLEVYPQILVGMAAIAGHNWPIFLRFSGGRGILTTVGVIFVLAPWLTLAMLLIAFSFVPFHQLPVGTLLALALGPLGTWFLAQPFHIDRSISLTMGFLAVFMLAIIRRLAVTRTELSISIPTGELLVNRLLFDRDIKDRNKWTKRSPARGTSAKNL
jgi:glycerol-3-phosphate acyltransferase PlsY